MATTNETPLTRWLQKMLTEHRLYASELARRLDISHATVSRWIHGQDIPKPLLCEKLAKLTREPLLRILALAGHTSHTSEDSLSFPPFREYIAEMYPGTSPDFVEAIARALES